MSRFWRIFAGQTAESPGAGLIALGASAVLGVAAGNLAPPERGWVGPLLALALLCGWRGLVRRRALLWWVPCGIALGLAACAAAARTPPGLAGKAVPVRFEVSVRDGWVSGARGWGTRVRLRQVEWAGRATDRPREMQLYIAAPVGVADLPAPGTTWAGAGELVFDRDHPLAPGFLRVKSMLLMRRAGDGPVVDRLREAGVRALERSAGSSPRRLRAAALASALALQRLESIQEGEFASMRRSGLVHLLSVSGLHVGLVGMMVWAILNAVGVRPGPRRWIVALAVVGFALLAGGNPPVRRAATAGVAYLVGRRLGRPLEPLPVVWGIVGALSLLEPSVLLQAGFQLSAFVTLALVRWVEPVTRLLRWLPTRLAQAASVALVAQGAAAPLVGTHFAVIPPLGVVASLLAAPLELFLVGASLLALVVSTVGSRLGAAALEAVSVGQRLLDGASAAGGGSSWPFPPPSTLVAAVLAALALVAVTRTRAAAAAGLTLAAGTAAWMLIPGGRSATACEVRTLGVSEGMALLLRCGDGSVLVDAGRSPVEAWRELARNRVRRLDALVVTHPDADHTGGAALLLDRLSVRRFAFPEALGERAEIVPLRRLARLRGVEEVPLQRGGRYEFGGAGWEVLWPPRTMEGVDNDASLVARVTMWGPRLLVAGDIEAPGEAALLREGGDLESELLQLPHHGSRTSSTPPFIAAVRPVVAIAATGVRPRFAYPNPSVATRVIATPAVLVSQGGGEAWVRWRRSGPLGVGGDPAVWVARSRRVPR
ncbi:MAG TPA: ComEC/Rec2 family competence protein [Thermoanaerobaculaceae bacterium]|nr:ComEC/Rec2 family competence protein [Thermoanaerobaculaceae bacterium]